MEGKLAKDGCLLEDVVWPSIVTSYFTPLSDREVIMVHLYADS